MADNMLDTNNFYCYFPKGYKRMEVLGSEDYLEKWARITSDLDELLGSVDLCELDRQVTLWHSKVTIALDLNKVLPKFAEKIGSESEEHCLNAMTIVYPYYCEMRALGYSNEELTT